MKQKTNRPPVLSFLSVAVFLIFLLSLLLGTAKYPAVQVFHNIFYRSDPDIFSVIWQVRMPRFIFVALAGSMIGASGTVLLAFFGSTSFSLKPVKLTALAGAVLCAAAAFMFAMALKMDPFLLRLFGFIEGATWHDVIFPLIASAVGILIVFAFLRDLNAMLFGEYTAKTLGVELPAVKIFLLAISVALALTAAWVAGIFSLALLIIPYYVRSYSGENHKYFIPASILAGAEVLVLCDILSRVIFPGGLPAGSVAMIIGGSLYLYALQKRRLGQ